MRLATGCVNQKLETQRVVARAAVEAKGCAAVEYAEARLIEQGGGLAFRLGTKMVR